ncbi:hypothetical protein JMA_42650 (plasmid) [Jeotgalibacillus malaysiensis]|uniref:Helicase HerA central domain-containing protein n=1 Tax=Jeotgalibacillus malaysiensis TaxID=1508404 RepID=A0A0B5AY05_9BACL|nr:ATP-binding protein [Jeotgalibacillus malaysiensis]AJD93582.1 hypothetical protein JMA_42650 [Jeotgalibacillus malaysiensis]
MFVIGKAGLRNIYLVSNETPFRINEYLMVNDPNHPNLTIEVIDTFTLPMAVPEVFPDGCHPEFLDVFKIDKTKPLYMAVAKVLKTIRVPVQSGSTVRKPDFHEVENLLLQADPKDSFHMGVILGTEDLQEQLPEEISNLSPLWKNKRAVNQEGVPFVFDYREQRVYPHIGLFGTSGSGKSFGLRVLCEELMRKNIPGLAFDPHFELNFNRPMAGLPADKQMDYSGRHQSFYIGKDIGITFSELSFDELVHLFDFVGSLTEPQVGALEAIYEKGDTLGHLKNKIVDLKVAFEEQEKPKNDREDLSDEQAKLYARFKNKVSGAKTLQALSWKMDSLEGTGVFDGDVAGAERALKAGKLAIIRGNMKHLQMISSYILKKFYKKRRAYQDAREKGIEGVDFFPMFFAIVDEAHNFAPKGDFNPTKKILRTIAQEARKYGIFEIFCTQKPNALDETILAQLNTKIIYRLNTSSDMEMVEKETNLTPQEVKTLPDLPSGFCFISSPILAKTFAVRFRTTFTESPHVVDPFDEFQMQVELTKPTGLDKVLKEFLPIKSTKIPRIQGDISDKANQPVSIQEITDELERMAASGLVIKKQSPMGIEFKAV